MNAFSRAVVVLSAGLLLGSTGVAQADETALDRYDKAGRWNLDGHPDCAEALAKLYVQGGAGAIGGPAGMIAGAATGLPDIYLDCPAVEPWMQNGT